MVKFLPFFVTLLGNNNTTIIKVSNLGAIFILRKGIRVGTPPLWRDLVKISTTKLWHTSSFSLECTDFKNVKCNCCVYYKVNLSLSRGYAPDEGSQIPKWLVLSTSICLYENDQPIVNEIIQNSDFKMWWPCKGQRPRYQNLMNDSRSKSLTYLQ